jgi:quercetin dioxygenase-like cupin family protein
MRNRNRLCCGIVVVLFVLSLTASVRGQTNTAKIKGENMSEMKFVPLPGMPTCSKGSVQSGDPTKGPSIILAKGAAGCRFPWHWHTANEHLMMVTGEGRLEMKDDKPLTLKAGGFAMMPSRHVHQFRCTAACTLYVYSDTAFDIHYVDAEGKEISPEVALKAVKETAAKDMP